jgi:hypothetical protein
MCAWRRFSSATASAPAPMSEKRRAAEGAIRACRAAAGAMTHAAASLALAPCIFDFVIGMSSGNLLEQVEALFGVSDLYAVLKVRMRVRAWMHTLLRSKHESHWSG